MKKLYLLAICLVVLGLVLGSFGCAAPKPAPTTPGEVSFAGKTITIIVAQAPGGGTDIMGRVWTKFLPKYLPGNPTVILRNMPGGDATIGANYFYKCKPDGLTTMGLIGSVSVAYVTRKSACQYDLQKVEAIIGMPGGGAVFWIKPGIVDKVEDLPKAKGITFAYTAGTLGWLIVACDHLNMVRPEKVVLAYGSTGEVLRAYLAGEINMSGNTPASYGANIVPLVKTGQVQTLFQAGIFDEKGEIVRNPEYADIPTAKEVYERLYGKSPSGLIWDAYKGILGAALGYEKNILLPPGVPDNIVKAWREAAEKMIKDPEFAKFTRPMTGGYEWEWGESFAKRWKASLVVDPKAIDWLKAAMAKHGVVID